METVVPSSLPPIDAVEAVDLAGLDPDRVSEYMAAAVNAPRVAVTGSDAERIACLWRGLPEGEQMRCHIPPFGLRFYSRRRLICEASVCWECNNIFGNAGGEHLWYGFDASHEHSRELLAACKRAIGRAGADGSGEDG